MLKKITLFLSVLFLLSACGGSGGDSSGGNSPTIKEKAIEKISAYAEDGNKSAPSLQDYIDAGVTGVTNDNLADLNVLVDSLEAEYVDTTAELDALIAQLSSPTANPSAPTANPATATTDEDTAKAILLTATDPEGSTLSYIAVTQPSNGTLSITGNTANYVPNDNYNGTDSFTYKVNDGELDSNTVAVNITVTPVNDLPVADNIETFTAEGRVKAISLMASDIDGDALIYSTVSEPAHGSVNINDDVATYTPTPNYNGRDSFSYKVFDGTGDSNTAIVNIFVGGLNDTGITRCGDDSSNDLACPVNMYPNQDAQSGRDVIHNDDSDGHAGFSYTKISSTGTALPASATNWSCVQDNVTGLMWEVKTDDGALHDKDNTYKWYNPDNNTNGGSAGNENGDNDTDSFVSNTNSAGLCGSNDWRLPNKAELNSIVNRGAVSPAIDSNYFPNTKPLHFWSSSPYLTDKVLVIHFDLSSDGAALKSSNYYVRLVRSGQ